MGSSPPRTGSAAEANAADRDAPLLPALRAGDEEAFVALVTRYHASLKRVARAYVSTDAVAEDVVQETWLAGVEGLHRFEQRASLKTWLFHILANKAKTRGTRERRTVPFASLARADEADGPPRPRAPPGPPARPSPPSASRARATPGRGTGRRRRGRGRTPSGGCSPW